MLDIKTKGGDSISFYFVATNFWENVNTGGKGRERMLTRGKKKQKKGERKKKTEKQEKRETRNKTAENRETYKQTGRRKAKKGNRNLKNNSEIQKKENGQILIPFYQHLTRC